jgi:asparagine synthetase B (glutamine-hydrolysing)
MMVSLESRVPLLEPRIVELAASMPPSVKFEAGRSKYIFRKVVGQLLPKGITERKDKMGFPVPLSEWYQREPVRGFVRETLLASGRASAAGSTWSSVRRCSIPSVPSAAACGACSAWNSGRRPIWTTNLKISKIFSIRGLRA